MGLTRVGCWSSASSRSPLRASLSAQLAQIVPLRHLLRSALSGVETPELPQMRACRLNLRAIEKSLRAVQREFPKINALLHSRRDSMSDEVVENMMAGYGLVDKVLADDTDIVTSKHAAYLLELNHTVL